MRAQAHEIFKNAKMRYLDDQIWQNFGGQPYNSFGHFANNKVSLTELHIWDKACQT
jgi:hypothetical protein